MADSTTDPMVDRTTDPMADSTTDPMADPTTDPTTNRTGRMRITMEKRLSASSVRRTTDESDTRGSAIKATIVRYDDDADECTLHPVDPVSDKHTTEWITAKQGGYVSLAAWQ
jgi:hypothetical protein